MTRQMTHFSFSILFPLVYHVFTIRSPLVSMCFHSLLLVYKVGEPITVGHLLPEGHHFYDEKTMKNEEKT